MSIPPLVCSTPPPPEQCEDDKDPEDFDLHYNLSQEDDENNDFEFGNLSTYNIHTSVKDKNPNLLSSDNALENVPSDNFHNINDNTNKETLNHVPDLPFEDDVQIEDLNLEINQEPIISSTKGIKEVCDINSDDKIEKNLQTDIPTDSINVGKNDFKLLHSLNEDNVTESELLSQIEKPDLSVGEISDSLSDKHEIVGEILDSLSDQKEPESISNLSCIANEDEVSPKELPVDNNIKSGEHDFEDFDDFKSVTFGIKSVTVVVSSDPWGSNTSEDIGFGEFTANFENVNSASSEPVFVEQTSSETNIIQIQSEKTNDNDDFGDFDEFKSSATDNKASIEPLERIHQQVPIFNIHLSNENQIIESINKVLETVFPEEISEPGEVLENKLEVSLGETWSYLKETDTRQPYMVNWNNSLAQKTLLKALCIDSRNILFGPKWSFSTPKYAANLSAAPLQPQKQTTQINMHQNENPIDVDNKTTTKTSWVDPFASDGQEFTYAEALLLDLEHLMATLDQMANNHSTLKISELLSHACNVENESNVTETVPTNLDVFEAAMSTKTDKIYSSTLNIQPIRQISLPDTHIFTPTDSETPRSKTIHYDNSTTHNILLPQPVSAVVKDQPDELPSKSTDNELQNDDEYWDFQDFRGNPDVKSRAEIELETKPSEIVDKDVPPKAKYPVETQVLQPIKLEPIMPTLNWPNPGQVKETFDDFSDFVSKSVVVGDKPDHLEMGKSNAESLQTSFENKHYKDKQIDKVEDDFDTFQSALPTSSTGTNYNHSDITLFDQNTPTEIDDFEPKFSKTEQIKPDNISILHTRPTENIVQKIGNSSNFDELNFKTHPSETQIPNFSLLQPTVTSSTQQGQQKTGQILQPLSLESYSQINWPHPGIDLQDLSRFNPVESLKSFKNEASSNSKNSSPIHNQKTVSHSQVSDEDIWGEFVSSKPKPSQTQPKKQSTFVDDDEWTDFVSSPSVNTQNGLNTISLNVHTNSSIQKSSAPKYPSKNNNVPLDIPTLNYITPKTANPKSFNDKHFQNL